MTINRPENLVEGVTPSQDEQNMRDFPELAEEIADRCGRPADCSRGPGSETKADQSAIGGESSTPEAR